MYVSEKHKAQQELKNKIAEAVAQEREACAELIEAQPSVGASTFELADLIRKRGN